MSDFMSAAGCADQENAKSNKKSAPTGGIESIKHTPSPGGGSPIFAAPGAKGHVVGFSSSSSSSSSSGGGAEESSFQSVDLGSPHPNALHLSAVMDSSIKRAEAIEEGREDDEAEEEEEEKGKEKLAVEEEAEEGKVDESSLLGEEEDVPASPAAQAGVAAEERVETEAERRAREERESEQLVWEMMRQEAQQAYDMQMLFMQEHADSLSAEDLAALQQAVNEAGNPAMLLAGGVGGGGGGGGGGARRGGGGGEDEQGDEAGDEEASEEEDSAMDRSDPDQWDYERLLQLGQVIGDVKTERWRIRADGVIQSLPKMFYRDILASTTSKEREEADAAEGGGKASAPSSSSSSSSSSLAAASSSSSSSSSVGDAMMMNISQEEGVSSVFVMSSSRREEDGQSQSQSMVTSQTEEEVTGTHTTPHPSKRICLRLDKRCAVCMDAFEESEELTLLPCAHYFHGLCATGWLADHNNCPVCKTKVSVTPV